MWISEFPDQLSANNEGCQYNFHGTNLFANRIGRIKFSEIGPKSVWIVNNKDNTNRQVPRL